MRKSVERVLPQNVGAAVSEMVVQEAGGVFMSLVSHGEDKGGDCAMKKKKPKGFKTFDKLTPVGCF